MLKLSGYVIAGGFGYYIYKQQFHTRKAHDSPYLPWKGRLEDVIYEFNGKKYVGWGLHCTTCNYIEIDDMLNMTTQASAHAQVDAWSNQTELMKEIEGRYLTNSKT